MESPFHLITQSFRTTNVERDAELAECLRRNCLHDQIEKIHLLNETTAVFLSPRVDAKIQETVIGHRLTYADAFKHCNENLPVGSMCILANSDIFFDQTLADLSRILPADSERWDGLVLALTRHEWHGTGGRVDPLLDKCKLFSQTHDSQDAWIFRTPLRVPSTSSDFALGRPGCDNRIVQVFREAGYVVGNACLTVRCYHTHASQVRTYTSGVNAVPPPYGYVYPRTLAAILEGDA